VKVAARLETLCEPGLCVSRAVRDQVRDKLPVAFGDLGEQAVKNIARPVRAFGLTPEAIAAAPDLSPSGGPAPTKRHRPWVGVVLAVIGIVGGAGAWWVVSPDRARRFPGFSRDEFGSLLRDPNQREKLARALKKAGL
jgi:hypothetical protein